MHKRNKGKIGEDVACNFLETSGFSILDRNYLKKWGEIDIVAQKDNKLHFFEVKSVTVDLAGLANSHQPEDNVHGLKVRHLRRIIETYLSEKDRPGPSAGRGLEAEFSVHVLCVFLDIQRRKARVKWIENVIL